MTKRLTMDMRNEIAEGIVAHAFKDRIASLVKRRAVFARAIYYDVFPRKQRDAMEAIPKGWLPTDNDIMISIERPGENAGTYVTRFTFNGEIMNHRSELRKYEGLNEAIRMLFPADMKNTCCKVYHPASIVAVDANALTEEHDAINAEIPIARRKAMAALNSFTTVEKLLEAWPEVHSFIPANKAPPPQLPALPTADLNQLFGLPVQE